MTGDILFIIMILIFSTIAFVVPDMWIHMRNPVGASILLMTNAICMTIYAYYYHRDECFSVNKDKVTKMILSGFLYFVGWILYISTFKYKKYSTALVSQTILALVLGGAFAMIYLENRYNTPKVISFIVGIVAIIIFAYGESQPTYPVYNK